MVKNNISIIIPVFGKLDLLKKCLKAINDSDFWSEYKGEIIIVNNSPKKLKKPDFTKRLFSKLSCKIINNKENLGFAKACNQGIKVSKGKLILFLNSDVYVQKNTITKLFKFINRRKKIAVAAPRLFLNNNFKTSQPYQYDYFPNPLKELIGTIFSIFYQKTKIIFFKKLASFFDMNLLKINKAKAVDWISGAALMVKKDVLEKIGGFDENFFFYLEDVDLQKRIKKLGYQVWLLPFAKAVHQWGGSISKSKVKSFYHAAKKIYYRKYYNHFSRLLFFVAEKIKNLVWTVFLKKKSVNSYQLPIIYLEE